ncbi:PAS domain S-box protein [Cellulophaga sp. E16_2]|uniref:PAS domain S-box protein n=1 Tax=Cellulophaga sp. E16_2 TaxID=2789297 RepID=UPI001A917965|nr:PAS domain S-box protein [Cellulophaga sp. E16_2]
MQTFEKNSAIFNLLSEGVSEGIIVVDKKQTIVATNSSTEQMFGYKKDELIGQPLDTLIPKRYHPNHDHHVDNFISKSEKRQMGHGRELFGVRKNGDEFPLEAGLNPFEIYNTTYVMALIIDITDRKAAEKDLRMRSEALQSASNGIVISDALKPDNPIIYCNTSFLTLTGYSEEETIGKNCRFLQGNDKNQECITNMRNAIKNGKSSQAIVRNYKKDGTLFYNDLYITPIRDKSGLITNYIGIQNDVTERVKTQQEKEHWAKIFNESLNEIFLFDKETLLFLNANKGAQNNIGYTLEELKKLTPIDIKPDYTENQFREILIPLINKEQEKIEFETTHQRKDGTQYPAEVHLQLSRFGDLDVFLAIILDITDRKNYTLKLEKTVQERTKQLTEALAKEKELNELKTRFLSLVSHEFKTPLSSILTSITLLAKYTQTEQQEKRDKHVNTIKSKVRYLDTILTDFLSVERLDSGKINYALDEFPLSKLLDEVIYNANMLLKTGQRISYPRNIDDIFIYFDEKTLALALSNLVHNAIKYSPENTAIDIVVENNETTINIKVIDHGIGIPIEEQKHIFNRYFRAENALLTQGTGIGLNIAQQHLENLSTTLEFSSIENEGSIFTITIPKDLKL